MRKTERATLKVTFYKSIILTAVCISVLFCFTLHVFSQSNQIEDEYHKQNAPKVFLDCEGCDTELLKKVISFVQYVEDAREAQVFIIVTSQETDTGDEEYSISFRGQGEFEGDNDELKYLAKKDKLKDKVQAELMDILKMGLMRYVGKTPISSRISINFVDRVEPTAVEDKWNFWVFSLSANTFLDGEKSYKSGMYNGSFSANRVTPELKIRLSFSAYLRQSEFRFDDQVIESDSDSQNLRGLVVKSVSEHWSVGAFFSVLSSTYTNVRLSINPAPAIEYNLFPYSESTRRQIRFLYRLGYTSVRYREETIYEKTFENLWQQALSVTFELKQKWGTVSTSLEGSSYFHDFSKNRIELWGELSFRLIKGLNFDVSGSYSRIRDQLSLPRGEASLEEVLLGRRQLETGYNYRVSVGLSYTFGSIHSKVVNPRFETGGKSISISF